VGAFLAWFAIVVLGRQPKGLQDMIVLGMSYQQRAYAYMALLSEDWPPFTDDASRRVEEAPSFGALPSTPPAAGTAPEAPAPPAATPAAPADAPYSPPEAPSSPPEAPPGTPAGPTSPSAPETPPTPPHGDPLGDEAAPPPPERSDEDEEPPPGPFGPSSTNP
jgi:hypothetical protein